MKRSQEDLKDSSDIYTSNSCYTSHPVFMYKTCQGFPIFLSALIACTDTLSIKLPLSYSSRPSRVRLPESPTALKLCYVSWTSTHSTFKSNSLAWTMRKCCREPFCMLSTVGRRHTFRICLHIGAITSSTNLSSIVSTAFSTFSTLLMIASQKNFFGAEVKLAQNNIHSESACPNST